MEVSRPTPRLLLAAVLAVVVLVIGSIGYLSIGSIGSILRPTPTPTPEIAAATPTPIPLAAGKQVYTMRTDSKTKGPTITEASFDPLDVAKGETITVEVNASGTTALTVTMIDDAGNTPHELSFTGGVWTGSWTAETTHLTRYGATIEAVNAAGEKRMVELWFR